MNLRIAILTTENREFFRTYDLLTPTFGSAPGALIDGFTDLPDAEVHVVSCTQKPVKSPEKLADNIFFHSVTVPKIGWMRTGYQGCIRGVRRKLREIRPDIVHGQGTERDCAISAVFSGYPNVITIHGNMRLIAKLRHAQPFSFPWNAARLEELTLPRADGIVCITEYTRKIVASVAKRTWVAPNAVERPFFKIKPVAAPIRRILCVGSVETRKNQNGLIRAVDILGSHKNFELVFVGGTNSKSPYEREFLDLIQSRPWCRFAGFADREALKNHLASASGLVLPSLEDNCPMVILEAMAASVPVAAARVGGVPELLRHEDTGLLFDPLNREAMAAAVKSLLASNNEAMVIRANAEARRKFHPEVIAARHLEIYKDLLSIPACPR